MTAARRVFLYGTLLDLELFETVSGGLALSGPFAVLPDHAVYWVQDQSFPVIAPEPGAEAMGRLVEAEGPVRDRLDFYELGFEYQLETLRVETESGREEALVYMPEPGRWPKGDLWSLMDWQARHGDLTREAAQDYMQLYGQKTPEEAARSFAQIRARADSRLRARANPSPLGFGAAAMAPATVEETRRPYTAYFGVQEDVVSVPTFAGGAGPLVERASWLGADAVTVLPYDPVRDLVLVVRQWRHGPFARGDGNPWCVEPPAGRIDPGETPEVTARRELAEETGVEAGDLHLVARYYPSPGGFSEHLTSFVALADLGEQDGTVSGLDSEHEDIMSHVLPFEALEGLIEKGAINTGPLILSIQWLAMNRTRLRAAH